MRTLFSIRFLLFAILALAALPCLADEVAVLKNGFSITHHRREIVGDLTRLYITADGASFVDVPTADIERYEAAPDTPAAPAQPFARTSIKTASPSADQKPAVDLNQVVNEASGRYRLDPDFVNSVIKAESGFNVRAVSRKGAQGLMQLMPGTASQLGVSNAFDPTANVDGGTRYLRELLERYNFDMVKALAAYNAGPQRVEHFGGVPPYSETRAYVARIVRDFNKKKTAKEKSTARNDVAVNKPTPRKKTTVSATKSSPASSRTEARAASPGLNQ
jgi:soluble lytic murein transglycosylase-like protein